jgi:hypothetical protein
MTGTALTLFALVFTVGPLLGIYLVLGRQFTGERRSVGFRCFRVAYALGTGVLILGFAALPLAAGTVANPSLALQVRAIIPDLVTLGLVLLTVALAGYARADWDGWRPRL